MKAMKVMKKMAAMKAMKVMKKKAAMKAQPQPQPQPQQPEEDLNEFFRKLLDPEGLVFLKEMNSA